MEVHHSNFLLNNQQKVTNQSENESLTTSYFRAVNLSTENALQTSISMLFMAHKVAGGYQSPHIYCMEKLGWTQNKMKTIFSLPECFLLREDPRKKDYPNSICVKLLTHVWVDVDRHAKRLARELLCLPYQAAHILSFQSEKKYRGKLDDLLSMITDFKKIILRYCQGILESILPQLWEKRGKLKERYGKIFNDLSELECRLSQAPLERAIVCMQTENKKLAGLAIDEIDTVTKDIPEYITLLEKFPKTYSKQLEKIKAIEKKYLNLVRMAGTVDIVNIINDVKIITKNQLQLSYNNMLILRKDRKCMLITFGRTDIITYLARHGNDLIDINRWLLKREVSDVNVEQLYSNCTMQDTSQHLSLCELLASCSGKITILGGPMGSGKSCFGYFALQKWRFAKDFCDIEYLTDLDLIIPLKTNVLNGHTSFKSYIMKTLLPQATKKFEIEHLYETLSELKVLFIIDVCLEVTDNILTAVKEVVSSLGTNSLIITVRLEQIHNLSEAVKEKNDVRCRVCTISPLDMTQVKQLCIDYIKNGYYPNSSYLRGTNLRITNRYDSRLHRNSSGPRLWPSVRFRSDRHFSRSNMSQETDINDIVDRFLNDISTIPHIENTLFYPLHLAYLLFLWTEEPLRIKSINTLSKLFQEILDFCSFKLKSKLSDCCVGQKKDLKDMCQQQIKHLTHYISKQFCGEDSSTEQSLSLGLKLKKVIPATNLLCWDCFYPFLVCSPDLQEVIHHHKIIHSAFGELFTSYAMFLLLQERKSRLLQGFKKNVSEMLPIKNIDQRGGKYTLVIRQLVALLHTTSSSQSMIRNLVDVYPAVRKYGDLEVWYNLLNECDWSEGMQHIIGQKLASIRTWHAEKTDSITSAACGMLQYGAFQPRRVYVGITTPPVVLTALACQPKLDVHIMPSHSWGRWENPPVDHIITALSQAGNITELWGRLEEKGAQSLARCTRLQTLNARITNLTALIILSTSLHSLTALQHFHLHLRLPRSMSTNSIPKIIMCSSSVRWVLTICGVTEDTWAWAVDIVSRLGSPVEVTFTQANLSPHTLQALKERLTPIVVHICN